MWGGCDLARGAQQQQALRNDPGFQKLPPQRQQQLMNQYRALSAFPENREVLQALETRTDARPWTRLAVKPLTPAQKRFSYHKA